MSGAILSFGDRQPEIGLTAAGFSVLQKVVGGFAPVRHSGKGGACTADA